MTQDEQDTLVQLEQDEARSRRHRQIGVWALLAVVLLLAAATAYGLTMGHHRQQQVDALAAQLSDSDQAAVEVASQRQAQARTVLELCESGAIEQDDAGVAVCDEAERAAEEDPAQAVAQAKGEQGPQGPRGPAGPAGSDGADGMDGADGADGEPGETGPTGADGSDGADGAPGEDGAEGADGDDGEQGAPGETGKAGTSGSDGKPGATGAQGATGAKGDPGPTGPRGATGERGPAGADGTDGADGRGIDSAQCGADGRWTITYTDGESEDAGPCIAASPTEPAPTPTPTEEVTE